MFVVGERGPSYELNLPTSDSPDQNVVISYVPKQLQAQEERARHGYVIEVENLAEFPVLLRLQEIDFAGMVAISTGDEFLQPRPKKASEAVQEKFRTRLYIVAVPV